VLIVLLISVESFCIKTMDAYTTGALDSSNNIPEMELLVELSLL